MSFKAEIPLRANPNTEKPAASLPTEAEKAFVFCVLLDSLSCVESRVALADSKSPLDTLKTKSSETLESCILILS